jgi:hypothetical protein
MSWSRTFELVLNLSTRQGSPLAAGRTDATPVESVTWYARDRFTLRIIPVERSASATSPTVRTRLAPGSVIVVKGNAKPTPGADPCLYNAVAFTEIEDPDDIGQYYYEATLDLNTNEGNAAVDALVAPQDALECLFDVEIQDAANTERNTFQFRAFVKKDVVRNQGTPTPGSPLYPSPAQILVANNNLSELASAPTARANLGLGSMATQDADAVDITGGTIDGANVTGLPAPVDPNDAARKADLAIIPTIVIDDNVIEFFGYPTAIADNQFEATGVTAVQIGNSVTTIGNFAFASNSLTSVTIPNSVTSIGSSAFQYNSLTSVTIPNSVTTIGSSAFQYNSLTSVTIPNSVTTIGSYAFASNSLTSVTIPNSVTTIGSYAFASNSLTSVTIPNSVTSIGSSAFQYNSLTSVTIPNSMTSIGSSAFQYNSLTSVTIPNSVTSIGDGAFSSNSLTSVTIPNSVTTIGSYAFSSNPLTSVTIPNSVTSIGDGAFFFNSNLATVNCYVTKTIIDAATGIFQNTASPLTIHARAIDGTWTAGTGLSIGGNTNVTVIKDL